MMSNLPDPREIPQWHAARREAALVRHLLGSGATALGRANYADKEGDYYTAFFGLSVGLERLAKLILVVDYAISNGGVMPKERVVRRFGHKLINLMDAVDKIPGQHGLELKYRRHPNPISAKIIECLDAFADAGRGRYANFAALGDPNLSQEEPIRMWWDQVAEMILERHYYGKQAQKRVESKARSAYFAMAPVTIVMFTHESEEPIETVYTVSVRAGQTEIVQRYGRYYALTIVRWLSDIFSKLTQTACYAHEIHAFAGVWEYVQTYTVKDHFLRTRKIWPLK